MLPRTGSGHRVLEGVLRAAAQGVGRWGPADTITTYAIRLVSRRYSDARERWKQGELRDEGQGGFSSSQSSVERALGRCCLTADARKTLPPQVLKRPRAADPDA
jgi:hypothetical protein